MSIPNNNPTPVIKVRRSNPALILAIQRAEVAKKVIIRGYGDNKKRVLDLKVNPLATITSNDYKFLLSNNILRDLGYDNLYEFNNKVKIEAA